MRISDGTLVKIAYQAQLDSGEIVDRVGPDQPLEFVYGQNQLLPGLEHALEGLRTGDRVTVVVSVEQSFGAADGQGIRQENWDQFHNSVEIIPGAFYRRNTQCGIQTVRALSVDAQGVWLDTDPLAGKEIIFEVEILDSSKKPTDSDTANPGARSCAGGCACASKCTDGKDDFLSTVTKVNRFQCRDTKEIPDVNDEGFA